MELIQFVLAASLLAVVAAVVSWVIRGPPTCNAGTRTGSLLNS